MASDDAFTRRARGAIIAAPEQLPATPRNVLVSALPWALAVGGLLYGALSGGAPAPGSLALNDPSNGPRSTGVRGITTTSPALGAPPRSEHVTPVSRAEEPAEPEEEEEDERVIKTIVIEEYDDDEEEEEEEEETGADDGDGGSATTDPTKPGSGSTKPSQQPPKQPQPAQGGASDEIPQFPSSVPALPCKRCFRYGSGMMTRKCLPAACPTFPATGRNVISTSLYGREMRYTGGSIRNAEIAPIVFPDWQLRFYVKNDVEDSLLSELKELGADISVLTATDVGFGMNWRFLVADDAAVDAFICRDADSR
jgi:hypothetical protein